MLDKRVAFVGAGHITSAMVHGLIGAGFSPDNIAISNRSSDKLAQMKTQFAVHTHSDNLCAVRGADIVFLAVKPEQVCNVAQQIAPEITENTFVVSLAAGVLLVSVKKALGGHNLVARVMPNVSARVGQSASVIFSDIEGISLLETVLSLIGKVMRLPNEDQMTAVTALSGSGPAYFFLLVELMIDAAVDLGLPRSLATELAVQTSKGASSIMEQSSETAQQLRAAVASRKGTTEAALDVLFSSGYCDGIKSALFASHERALELTVSSE